MNVADQTTAEVLYTCDSWYSQKNGYSVDPSVKQVLSDISGTISWASVGESDNIYNVSEQGRTWVEAVMEEVSNAEDAIGFRKEFTHHDLSSTSTREDIREYVTDSDLIALELSGKRGKTNGYTALNCCVIDNGIGQHPSEFEEKFVKNTLDVGTEKQGVLFAGGENGRGLLATIPFSESGCKFIASSSDDADEWAFTILKKNGSRIEYLTVDGEIPTVSGPFNTGQETLTQGTVVKTYDISSDHVKNAVGRSFIRQLRLEYPDPIVPVTVREKRNSESVEETIEHGLLTAAEEHPCLKSIVSGREEVIDGLGPVELTVFTVKDDDSLAKIGERQGITIEGRTSWDKQFFNTQNSERVYFTVHGQTHNIETSDWLDVGAEVADNLLIVVDSTEVYHTYDDIFKADRTSVMGTEHAERLLNGVNSVVSECDEVCDLLRQVRDTKDNIRSLNVVGSSVTRVEETQDDISVKLRVDGATRVWESEQTHITLDSSVHSVTDVTTISDNTVTLTVDVSQDRNASFSVEMYNTEDGSIAESVLSVKPESKTRRVEQTVNTSGETQESESTDASDFPVFKPTVLTAAYGFAEDPSISQMGQSQIVNRANSQGERLEKYVKELYCGVPISDQSDDKLLDSGLDFRGNSTSIPDFIATDSDAVEVKKMNTMGNIQLNSSIPHRWLKATDARLANTVPTEGWERKEIVYALGVMSDSGGIDNLWLVDGRCWAKENELYTKVEQELSRLIAESELDTSETGELGRINSVGGSDEEMLAEVSLRIRGMWTIEHPAKCYEQFIDLEPSKPNFVSVVPTEKYTSYPDAQKDAVAEHPQITVKHIETGHADDKTTIITVN